MVLPTQYFTNPDVVDLAKDLIGKLLVTEKGSIRTSGIIVETEAYRGADDKACHAFNYRRTARTETMFREGGHSYVYLCYGIHPLFNIVANKKGEPDAVLIRALAPWEGIELMKERRPKIKESKLASGPGCLTKALGISLHHNTLLLKPQTGIWLEETPPGFDRFASEAKTRIGVDYAGEDAKRPWRFVMAGHSSLSKP
jgi:DNA-3-methyladenine glycosylase